MAIHFTNTGETAPSFFLREANKGIKEKKEQMNTRTLLVVSASVAAMITGCESIDKSALAGAGLAAASAGKGGNKAGAAVAAGTVGVGVANTIVASRTETKSSNGNASSSAQSKGAQSGTQTSAPHTTSAQTQTPAVTAQPKPKYTAEQYRAAFAKRTPAQIAAYIIAVSHMSDDQEKTSRHDVKNMVAALTWRNGFDVVFALREKNENPVFPDYGFVQGKILQNVYYGLKDISNQSEIKELIAKLPNKVRDCGFPDRELGNHKGIEFYRTVIEKITDPTLADYMLERNLYLGYAVYKLVPKLSKAKKDELYAAAMKRAAERKDRIVMEGYYIGMPFLDALILRDHYGFNVQLKDGTGPIGREWIGGDDMFREDYFTREEKLPSEAEVNRLSFANKAWIKFMDCEDSDALVQFIHQYVKKEKGKPRTFAYLKEIKHEVVKELDGAVAEVYSSTKLGTKVAFDRKTGWIAFLEF